MQHENNEKLTVLLQVETHVQGRHAGSGSPRARASGAVGSRTDKQAARPAGRQAHSRMQFQL